MGNKVVVIILSILFIICLSLGIIGLLNKDNVNKKPIQPPSNSNIPTINYNNDVKDIESLNEKIENFEFIKANKEFSSDYIKVYITEEEIKIEVQKNGIANTTEETPDVIPYSIKDIKNPVAVQAQLLSGEGNKVYVYTLDAYGRLYVSSFNSDPIHHQGITTSVINIDNVTSFVELNIPLTNDNTMEQNYVVFKVNDEIYYTDYIFDPNDEYKITRINNIEPQVENVETN